MKLLLAFLAAFLTYPAFAGDLTDCDRLASLEADTQSVSKPVAFVDIRPAAVIEACTNAIHKTSGNTARYYLQRARGHLRAGQGALAIKDLKTAHGKSYSAGTFGLATAYFLGEDISKDHDLAETLYFQSFESGTFWAARGLASLYGDPSSNLFDFEQADHWETKFIQYRNIHRVIGSYRKRCATIQDELMELSPDGSIGSTQPLQVNPDSIFDVAISKGNQSATILYADFFCENEGRNLCGSSGCDYFIAVNDQMFKGTGPKPYAISDNEKHYLILPSGGAACTQSDGSTALNTSPSVSVASWDQITQRFISVGNRLTFWEPLNEITNDDL